MSTLVYGYAPNCVALWRAQSSRDHASLADVGAACSGLPLDSGSRYNNNYMYNVDGDLFVEGYDNKYLVSDEGAVEVQGGS